MSVRAMNFFPKVYKWPSQTVKSRFGTDFAGIEQNFLAFGPDQALERCPIAFFAGGPNGPLSAVNPCLRPP